MRIYWWKACVVVLPFFLSSSSSLLAFRIVFITFLPYALCLSLSIHLEVRRCSISVFPFCSATLQLRVTRLFPLAVASKDISVAGARKMQNKGRSERERERLISSALSSLLMIREDHRWRVVARYACEHEQMRDWLFPLVLLLFTVRLRFVSFLCLARARDRFR